MDHDDPYQTFVCWRDMEISPRTSTYNENIIWETAKYWRWYVDLSLDRGGMFEDSILIKSVIRDKFMYYRILERNPKLPQNIIDAYTLTWEL